MRYGKRQNGERNAGRPVASGQWPVTSGQYAVESGEWRVESGEQGRRKGEGGRRKDRHAPHSSFIIHHSSFRPVRRAVTLIEMLIVLFIISLLAVMALRALPGEDQRPRETGRMLSVYIATAKNNAAATGRPSGVIFRPSNISTYSGYCTVVEQCEVPPTYAGDMLSAQVMAQDWTYVKDINGPGMVPYCADGRPVIKLLIPANEFPENLIRYGDRIQINGQGPIYTICWDGENQNGKGLFAAPPTTPADFPMVTRNPSADVMSPPPPLLPTNVSNKQWPQEYNFPNSLDKNGNPDPNGYISCLTTAPVNATFTQPDNLWVNNYCVTCYLEVQNSVPLPWPKSVSPMGFFGPNPPTPPISFTIIRQPEKSAAAPLQLPAGAGIDLMASGTENGLILAGNSAIMFSPSGAVDALYINGTPYKLSHTIHLLVGKLTVGGEPNNNYADLKNILVSINPQTGTISTSPVYPPFCVASPGPPPYPNDPPAVQNTFDPANPPAVNYSDNRFVQALFYSRKFAREAQTMGGKR